MLVVRLDLSWRCAGLGLTSTNLDTRSFLTRGLAQREEELADIDGRQSSPLAQLPQGLLWSVMPCFDACPNSPVWPLAAQPSPELIHAD